MFIDVTLFFLPRKYNDAFLERKIDEVFKVFTLYCFNWKLQVIGLHDASVEMIEKFS